MEFNLDTAPAVPPTLNMDTGVAPVQPPSDEVARTRAYKAHMGLGEVLRQDAEQIYRNIADGKEQDIRETAALEITNRAMEKRQQRLVELAATKGSNLTLADVASLDAPPVRPNAVIEQAYGRSYMNTIDDAAARIEGNVLDEAKAQNPDAVKEYMNRTSDVLSNREYAVTLSQNIKADLDKVPQYEVKDFMGITHKSPTDLDFKQLTSLGFYEGYVLRRNLDTKSTDFLGNILDNKAKEILRLPAAEFQVEMDRLTNGIKEYDNNLAYKWVNAVVGMSSKEKFLTSMWEVINVATLGLARPRGNLTRTPVDGGGLTQGPDGVYRPNGGGPAGPAAPGARPQLERPYTPDNVDRAAMTAQEVLRGSPEAPLSRNVQQARQAVEDVLKSSTNPNVSKITIAEGAGDVTEAAVQRVVQSTVVRPDPTQDGLNTLLSIHRANDRAIAANPGNNSREVQTRLMDASIGYEKNVVDLFTNSARVMRLPAFAEDGFRQVAAKIQDYFPGRESTIMDATVRYDPIGNTHWLDTAIGNYGAVPFTSYELAAKHAEQNGYPVAVEGSAPEKLYISPTVAKNITAVKTTPDGTKFYVDQDIEADSSPRPVSGFVPYNLATQKFEPVLTEQTARIEQQGLGFYVVVTKPISEVEPYVREGLIADSRTKSISNKTASPVAQAVNAFLGYIRNPYDTLSKAENENRAKTVFGQSKFIELVKNEMGDIEDIYKGMLTNRPVIIEKPIAYLRTATGDRQMVARQFTRALELAQTAPDPNTRLPGYYMQTPAEIQHLWQLAFQRPATEKEQAAYLAVARIGLFDHMLRQAEQFKFKARLGVESWNFNTIIDGKSTPSVSFDAAQIKKVHGSIDDVALIVDANGHERYYHAMGTTAQTEFRTQFLEGRYLGVEIYNPEARPIKRKDVDGNDLRIRYVYSNSFQRKPITFDQMGYRGGGHWQYDYEQAVKQSIIKVQRVGNQLQHIYEGDTTFGFVSNKAMGETFAIAMNEIARLIRAKKTKEARAYAKTVFDIEWKKMYGGFRPSKNPITGEVQPPRFSTDPRQAFRVVPNGRTIFDLDKDLESKYQTINPKTQAMRDTFVNGTRHGSMARNFQTEFTQPRESYELNEFYNVGTPAAPFYEFRPAQLTDPLSTLIRSVDRIVNSTYMNDMKITAVEHWLQENKDLLDADILSIRSSPFHFFNEGKFKNNPFSDVRISNAQTNRYKIKQLLGMPSAVDSAIQGTKQILSDALYAMGRDRAVNAIDKQLGADTKLAKVIKAPLIAPEWLLDRVGHPVDFLRGMTFHLNLGLFALKQVVVQSMAYTSIFGIAGPKYAAPGSFAALMHQWSRLNKDPAIIDKMDVIATQFGWRLGEFKEAMKQLDRTGFGNIGNEISLDNGLSKETFMRSDIKEFLGLGQVPFNFGNLHVRFGAWYTAFREYRDKNPHTRITPIEEGKILYRANYFNALMTRDANTVLNKGLIGVPFQFYDYMKKMADVFWSKNLGEDNTPRQLVEGSDGVYRETNTFAKRSYVRARMFLMYAMLGGVAGSTGVTGLPLGDVIRKSALAGDFPGQGGDPYVPGEKLGWTLLMEGPTSVAFNALTGNYYNFNNRFNPNGLQILRDITQTDPSFWKILLGAMGTTVGNEIASVSGFTNALYSMMNAKPGQEAWPLKVEDWMAMARNIRTFSDLERLHFALAYGEWVDKHKATIDDITMVDAVFRTLTGLNDVRVDDMYLKRLIQKDRKTLYEQGAREYQEQRRLAEQATANGDKEQADDYNKRAFFALTRRQVPVEMWPKIFARDATMNQSTIEKSDESYWLKYVPTDKQEAYRRAFIKTKEQKAK